jgi:hypothetical protein
LNDAYCKAWTKAGNNKGENNTKRRREMVIRKREKARGKEILRTGGPISTVT